MSSAGIIRKQLKILEKDAALVEDFRICAKTDGGRMQDFGRDFLALCRQHGIQQSFVAKLLAISSGAVSQHYNR
ncbi:hypothetical protein NKI51_17400 [Mesorhizobium australicum]|uniref:hypothetical protein n=1 Tax=Mesorhizobium australicum TaxID=536018 RepID=UPI003338EDF2